MADDFTSTIGALRRRGRILPLLVGAHAVLFAWIFWAIQGQVSLYEISNDARIELESATYSIEAQAPGRVISTSLRVGQEVRRGDVLVEIDTMGDRLQRRQEQERVQGLRSELESLRAQLEAEQWAGKEEQQSMRLREEEALSRLREAQLAEQDATRELERIRKLFGEKLVAAREYDKAQGEWRRMQAQVATLQSGLRRISQEQTARDRERDARIQGLRREMAELEAGRRTIEAGIDRLGYEVERKLIRAPVSGRVGEAAVLRTGAVVAAGEKLGSVVPAGRLAAIAHFPAQAAFGRIRPGQTGTLRLSGWPWAEYGTVTVTVVRVAQEVRDGKARVELEIAPTSSFRGRLEHGMPGTLEVTVERSSPLALGLRTSGGWLTRRP